MQDEFNPYAAPVTTSMHPRAAEWLRSTSDPSLQKVARGLGLIYTGIVLFLASIILMFVLGILFQVAGPGGGIGPARGPLLGFPLVVLLGLLGMVVAYVLSLTGSFMCLATPQETGARGVIIASVVLMVVSLVLTIVDAFREDDRIEGLTNLCSLIGLICFIVFLKRLAAFIGAVHLAERARNILIAMIVGVGLLVATTVLAAGGAINAAQGAGGGGMLAVALVIGLTVIVGGLVILVMYANLINNLRKAIQSGGAVYS